QILSFNISEQKLIDKCFSSKLVSKEIFDRKFKRVIRKEQKLIIGFDRRKDNERVQGLIEKTGSLNFSIDEKNIFLNTIKNELNNFERFRSKLCGGSEQNFRVKKCGDCGKTIEYKSDGKTPIVYPVVCESPYCAKPPCIIHRKLKAELLFNVFLWGNKHWIKQRDIRTE
ncbi:unnamed protein product, partial [marine sediment metagenome]